MRLPWQRPRHRWVRQDKGNPRDPRIRDWICERCGEEAYDDQQQMKDDFFPCVPRAEVIPAAGNEVAPAEE